MKRLCSAILLVSIIIAIPLVTWLLLNQFDQQTCVRIVAFNLTSKGGPGPVSTLWSRSFNVTVQNLGGNVTGLTIQIRLSANSSEIWSQTGLYVQGKFGIDATLDMYAGEIRDFDGGFWTSLNALNDVEGEITTMILVMRGNTVLDEFRIS